MPFIWWLFVSKKEELTTNYNCNLKEIFIGFLKSNGYEGMIQDYGYAVADTVLYNYTNNTEGIPVKDFQNLVRGVKTDYPWPGKRKQKISFLNIFLIYIIYM